jgi:hypothetical protein
MECWEGKLEWWKEKPEYWSGGAVGRKAGVMVVVKTGVSNGLF